MRSSQEEGVEIMWRRNGPPGKIAIPVIMSHSRIRQRVAQIPPPPPKAYRLGFNLERIGRIRPDTKRRYRWSFTTGSSCPATTRRCEEHHVELVWSILSCKTRIIWNGQDISNLFRKGKDKSSASTKRSSIGTSGSASSNGSSNKGDVMEFQWQTRAGEELKVVVNSESIAGGATDLMIDGTSFLQLPHFTEARTTSSNTNNSRNAPQYNNDMSSTQDTIDARTPPAEGYDDIPADLLGVHDDDASTESMSELGSGDPLDAHAPDDIGYRLSMVGLSSGLPSTEPVDELHSELYSPMLESLRRQITDCLPQTEEMISRAIIQAFFPDYDSISHDDVLSSSTISGDDRDQQVAEADALWEAREWVSLNVEVAPRPDTQDMALSYMQKQIEGVFVRVRNEELTSDEAARQLLGVAAVLGLNFDKSVPADTIILIGLDKTTPVEDFCHAMTAFGPVEVAAISSRGRDFAFCRFTEESSVDRVQEAAENGRLQVGDSHPCVSVVSEKLYACNCNTESDSRPRGDEDEPSDDPPSLQLEGASGHESATAIPHLMGPLGGGGDDNLESDYAPTFVTPDHSIMSHHQSIMQAELMKSRTSSTASMDSSSYRRGAASSSLGSPDSLNHANLTTHHNLHSGRPPQQRGAAYPRFV